MSIPTAGATKARASIQTEADLKAIFGRHAHRLSAFQRNAVAMGVEVFGDLPQNEVYVFCLHRQRLELGELIDLNPILDRHTAAFSQWIHRNIPGCKLMIAAETGKNGMLHWNGVIHTTMTEKELRAKFTRLAKGNGRNQLWFKPCGYSSTAEGVARWLAYGSKRAGEKIDDEAIAEWIEELFRTVPDRKRLRVIGVRTRCKAKTTKVSVDSKKRILPCSDELSTYTYLRPGRVLVQNHRPLFGDDPPPYELRRSGRPRRWNWEHPRVGRSIRYVGVDEFDRITSRSL